MALLLALFTEASTTGLAMLGGLAVFYEMAKAFNWEW